MVVVILSFALVWFSSAARAMDAAAKKTNDSLSSTSGGQAGPGHNDNGVAASSR